MSITTRGQFFWIAAGEGIRGCRVPIGTTVELMLFKLINSCHFPDLFYIIKTGEFHLENEVFICPSLSCSTNSVSAFNFMLLRVIIGHSACVMLEVKATMGLAEASGFLLPKPPILQR